jgi:hypothetical protein
MFLNGWRGEMRSGRTATLVPSVFFDRARPAGALADRVEHAESDPVAEEGGEGLAVHGKDHRSVLFPLYPAPPGERYFTLAALDIELEVETLFGALQSQPGKPRGHRSPVTVPDGYVDITQDFPLPDPDSAQERRLRIKQHHERSGPHLDRLGRGLGTTAANHTYLGSNVHCRSLRGNKAAAFAGRSGRSGWKQSLPIGPGGRRPAWAAPRQPFLRRQQ